jgi:hypothetical protein
MVIEASRAMNSIAAVVILATLMITATTYSLTNSFAQIVLNLTGSEEVPPVQTEATGVVGVIPRTDSIV